MSRFAFFLHLALLSAGPVLPLHAYTATGLSSFDAIEEPLVRYYPGQKKFVPDDFVNITDLGGGTFRMFDRFNAEWWDGDRDTKNNDRQRAEVKGLGPHQFNGDTFEYATTWRLSPDFRGTAGFCHIFQLKAVNGDDGAPLITMSIHGDTATVEANPAGPKIIAREFHFKPGVWLSVRIRVKTTPQRDGELLVSVNGDEFKGVRNVEISRPQANEYRPKWGLYRKATVQAPMGDDYVEHREIHAQNLATPVVDNAALENEARSRAVKSSPAEALTWLQGQAASPARDFAVESIAGLWAETAPAEAMARAETLPAGAMRTEAIGRVFARWADRDLRPAVAWLHAHAPNAELDPLVWLFTTDTTYRYVNRPVALDSAPLIAEPKLRALAYEHILGIWAREDKAAARKFLEECPALTEEQKAEVAKALR